LGSGSAEGMGRRSRIVVEVVVCFEARSETREGDGRSDSCIEGCNDGRFEGCIEGSSEMCLVERADGCRARASPSFVETSRTWVSAAAIGTRCPMVAGMGRSTGGRGAT
jgi:hypothetical protein